MQPPRATAGSALPAADSDCCGPVQLLLRAPDPQERPLVLLHRPATGADRWELPQAAQHYGETPDQTARRIVAQAGADPGPVRVRGERIVHAGSSDPLVIADRPEPFAVPNTGLAWIPEPEVSTLDLDPALTARWPALQAAETGLLIDAANVVGSRPDGWWRDRAGAAHRLLRDIAAATPSVFPALGGRFHWIARPVVVLEGAANRAPDVPGVEVVRAPGSGDDTIVDVARRGGDWLVVTADRRLRTRLPVGAHPIGPATLHAWL